MRRRTDVFAVAIVPSSFESVASQAFRHSVSSAERAINDSCPPDRGQLAERAAD